MTYVLLAIAVIVAISLSLVYMAEACYYFILRVIIKKIIETKIEIKVAEVKNNGN